MNPLWIIAIAAIVYGSAAYLGVESGRWICERIVPFEDGPTPGRPRPILLIAGSALLGGVMATLGQEHGALLGQHGLGLLQLLAFAAIDYGLVACWYTDVRSGIVPDVFTLGTLGLALVIAGCTGDFYHLASAVVIALPFAAAALFSRGRGMGWGDVKLVTLGGATLGFFGASLAFAGACLVAVVVAFVRRRRSEPIAFAPYLIGSLAAALAFPGLVP